MMMLMVFLLGVVLFVLVIGVGVESWWLIGMGVFGGVFVVMMFGFVFVLVVFWVVVFVGWCGWYVVVMKCDV